MAINRNFPPLFKFANHDPNWLEVVKENTKEEFWGEDLKVLEFYLRINFEIAKQQSKVFESEEKNIALWRAGYLVTPSMDPVWMHYEINPRKDKQKWKFKGILIGENPLPSISASDYSVTYNPPEFNSQWDIYIDPRNFEHIIKTNSGRLVSAFGDDYAKNSHRLFRTIYGEIKLEQKEAMGVIPQWYMGDYNFLMPLYLNSPDKVDLTAALTRDKTMKRYQLRTLLLPHYAYAYARAIVKSRSQLASWAILDKDALSKYYDDNESDDE